MTQNQAKILSHMAYLDKPPEAKTLNDVCDYYFKFWSQNKHIKKYAEKLEEYEGTFKTIREKDDYLKNLKLVGYQNNNREGSKSGFVGYAFEDAEASGNGVVAFRGSEAPFEGNFNDWLNNLEMETSSSSAQMKDALAFMADTENGAGRLKRIETVGHSLGGYHAGTQAILDPRVTNAMTFNAPGVSLPWLLKNMGRMTPENLGKISAYNAGGDLVSKLGIPLGSPTKVSGALDVGTAHKLDNFEEGSEAMPGDMFTIMGQDLNAGGLAGALNGILLFATGVSTAFDQSIPGAIDKSGEKFTEFQSWWEETWESLQTSFSTCWDGIGVYAAEEIPGMVEGLKLNWDGFQSSWSGVWEAVKFLFTGSWGDMKEKSDEEVPSLVDGITEYVSGLPGKVGTHLAQIVTDLGTWISNLIFKNDENMPLFIDSVVLFFQGLPGKIGEKLTEAVGKIGEWAASLIGKSDEKLPGVITEIMSYFEELPDKVFAVGGDLVQGIFNGISNTTEWLWDQIRGWCGNVVQFIKDRFGINSPSKVMRDTVGVGIAEGVALGITENTNLVEKAMSDMADVISSSNVSLAPEVDARSIDLEALKEKLRPSLDYVRAQLARAQELMTVNFTAGAQLAAIRENAAANAIYNNGHTFHNSYNITAADTSPKATADAIKNQMTMQRMLFAMR